MRKKILPFLKCPNNHLPGLKAFGYEIIRDGNKIFHLHEAEMQDDDDIISGILVSVSSHTVYPIDQSVAILLSFNDADSFHNIQLLVALKTNCPEEYRAMLDETLQKISHAAHTSDGIWNRDEMRYYDAEVETEHKRGQMLETIKKVPVHRILIPRERHITRVIAPAIKDADVLEIGCGNASTIFRILNPATNHYRYIGSDISFKRLLVAKMAIPEGDFIQASALNLPFIDNCFSAVISFGMLHHLPRPMDAVTQVMPLIKKNGFFAFHEPVIRPSIYFPGLEIIKRAMTTYQHSEHDGKINLGAILKSLTDSGFKIIHKAGQISSIRSITETILKKINRKIMLNKKVIRVIEKADNLILNSLPKISKKAGPKAVFVVLQKD